MGYEWKRLRKVLVVMVVTALALAACGSGGGSSTTTTTDPSQGGQSTTTTSAVTTTEPDRELTVVNVGLIPPRLASVSFLLAEDYLLEEGILLRWNYFESDGAVALALAAGAIDMAINTTVRVAQMNAEGADMRIFSLGWGALDWLFVGSDDIPTVEDLVGATIAISSPGSTTDLLTERLLNNHGMTLSDVNIVQVGGTPARAGALAAGSVDASWIGIDAAWALLEQEEGFHDFGGLSVPDEFPEYLPISWQASAAYIEAHPDVVQAIAIAQLKANRAALDKDVFFARAERSVVGIISDQPIEQMEWAYAQYVAAGVFPVNGGLTESAIQGTLELAMAAGEIPSVPSFDSVAVATFEQKALEELGLYED